MFAYCNGLISINLANFETSKVKSMDGVFASCGNLKYLDLQHFSDEEVNNADDFFGLCSNLLYLNLKSFVSKNKKNINICNTFIYYPSNIKFCIEDSNTINKVIGDKTNDCSDSCFQQNVIFDIEKGECICNDNYKFEYHNICYQDCPTSTFTTFRLFNNKYICSPNVPENFYLDIYDNIYKECYSTCKSCNQSGNNDNHNCQECKQSYRFIDDRFSIENNCYQECSSYYYFTGINQYYCSQSCSVSSFNKVIEPKKKCIDDCKNDDEYIS